VPRLTKLEEVGVCLHNRPQQRRDARYREVPKIAPEIGMRRWKPARLFKGLVVLNLRRPALGI
jgi:hypothetical protein